MMVKAQVSPGLRSYTSPQTGQPSTWCAHPEKSGPFPQCGQRLAIPRRSAVRAMCQVSPGIGAPGTYHGGRGHLRARLLWPAIASATAGEDAEVKSWDCHFSDTLLAGVAHAGGDAVDGDDEGMAELWIGLVLAHAPEHFNLHQIDRIDVRVPHID
jgi:hypothetical protein